MTFLLRALKDAIYAKITVDFLSNFVLNSFILLLYLLRNELYYSPLPVLIFVHTKRRKLHVAT
jgi:hypothetical protein